MNQLFSIFMPRVSITSCLPFYPYYIMDEFPYSEKRNEVC